MVKYGHNEALHCEFLLGVPSLPPPQVHMLSSHSVTERETVPQPNQLHLSFPQYITLTAHLNT